jgi:hypothetical protein
MRVRLPCSCGELCYLVSLAGVAQLEALRVWCFLTLCIYASVLLLYPATS